MASNSPTGTATAANADNTSPRPVILLIGLDQRQMFDELYNGLIDQLAAKATVKRANKAQSAATFLTSNTPAAVIITHGKNAERKQELNDLNTNLVSYVTKGGTVILGALFSSFVTPPNFNRWMSETWKLPWKTGDYHRIDVFQNPRCDLEGYSSGALFDSYSQKALFLQNVDKNAAVYLPSRNSRTQSAVFAPENVDVEQTPIAFAKYGAGRLGYIGDVNNEEGSVIAIMTMCNL